MGKCPASNDPLNANAWEIAAAAVLCCRAAGGWVSGCLLRKRPTPEELERARRQFLAHSGRLVDGMLLDICEVEAPAKTKNEPAAP